MKRFPLWPVLLLAAVFFNGAQALEVPGGGREISVPGALQAHVQKDRGQVEDLAGVKRITITKPDSGKAYLGQFSVRCSGDIQEKEVVLAIVKARVIGQTNPGVMSAKLQLAQAPYTPVAGETAIEVSKDWTELPVTFIANQDVAAGLGTLVLFCGQKAQSIEVESVQMVKYPAGTSTAAFPRIKRSYVGREADAPWRQAALERIEKQRKADLMLSLTGSNGKPLADTMVKLRLSRHEFGFGSAVTAKHLTGEGQDDQRVREVVDRLFSIVVFENDLKDANWDPGLSPERKARRNAQLDKAFEWLAARHLPVRGHYLMQVATPFNLHDIKDNALIRDRTLASVKERLEFVKDRVVEWDVINHPIAWSGADMLNKRVGLERLDRDVFEAARAMTKLPFFVNEDQVFRPGPQHDDTFKYIAELNASGLTVAGLGNQAHFHESYLPSPEHLLAVTDRFAQIVPRQSITEYDIVTTVDEELAADYTRDILIATFSHPAYSSFLFWGFWEGSHWKPEAASWNKDWSIRKRGEVLEEWLGRKWRTEVTLKTDGEGRLKWRGFPGWYEVSMGDAKKDVYLPKAHPAGGMNF